MPKVVADSASLLVGYCEIDGVIVFWACRIDPVTVIFRDGRLAMSEIPSLPIYCGKGESGWVMVPRVTANAEVTW